MHHICCYFCLVVVAFAFGSDLYRERFQFLAAIAFPFKDEDRRVIKCPVKCTQKVIVFIEKRSPEIR